MAVFRLVGIGNARKYWNDAIYSEVIEYCQDQQKLIGGWMGGVGVNPNNAVSEMKYVAWLYPNHRRKLRHMIFSFSPKELVNPERALDIALEIALFYHNRFQVAVYILENEPELEAHLVMNCISYRNGEKYKNSYDEYFNFCDHASSVLLSHGITLYDSNGNICLAKAITYDLNSNVNESEVS